MDAERIATQILFVLVNYVLSSTVLLGAAWVITRGLSEERDAWSEVLWKAALTASVIAPALQALMPEGVGRSAPILPATIPLQLMHVDTYALDGSISVAIVSVWALIATCGVIGLVRSYLMFRSTLRTRRPLTEGERELIGGFEAAHAITVSPAVDVPIALMHEICLPVWAIRDLSRAELRAVLAHEAAHIQRGDARWRWLSSLVARVLFFQPLNFVARNKLHELSECLCDDEAIERTRSANDLAAALASFAALAVKAPRPTLAPSLASRESLTLRRVRRILAPASRSKPFRVLGELPHTALAACFTVMCVVAPRIVPENGPAMPYVVTASDPAGPFTLTVHRGRVIAATVDGRAVSADRLIQVGPRLRVVAGPSPFTIELKPGGGITWLPRPAAPSHL